MCWGATESRCRPLVEGGPLESGCETLPFVLRVKRGAVRWRMPRELSLGPVNFLRLLANRRLNSSSALTSLIEPQRVFR